MLSFEVESHNKVTWTLKHRYLWIWVGLFLGLAGVIALMAPSPAEPTLRNASIIITALITVGTSVWLVLASPGTTRGTMERMPDGGTLVIERQWVPFIDAQIETLDLDKINDISLEQKLFERSPGNTLNLARLWVSFESRRVLICDWAALEAVEAMGEALAKAARKPYQQQVSLAMTDGSK